MAVDPKHIHKYTTAAGWASGCGWARTSRTGSMRVRKATPNMYMYIWSRHIESYIDQAFAPPFLTQQHTHNATRRLLVARGRHRPLVVRDQGK